jgi:hypothetical protein
MVLQLDPELEAAITAAASRQGTTAEQLAVDTLRKQFPPPPFEPRDEWERRLLSLATDCGVSLTNEQLSREEMYD